MKSRRSPPRWSRMKRLVTERDAKKIKSKGKYIKTIILKDIKKAGVMFKYQNATYIEWVNIL